LGLDAKSVFRASCAVSSIFILFDSCLRDFQLSSAERDEVVDRTRTNAAKAAIHLTVFFTVFS
jgi:hypothetical protein